MNSNNQSFFPIVLMGDLVGYPTSIIRDLNSISNHSIFIFPIVLDVISVETYDGSEINLMPSLPSDLCPGAGTFSNPMCEGTGTSSILPNITDLDPAKTFYHFFNLPLQIC